MSQASRCLWVSRVISLFSLLGLVGPVRLMAVPDLNPSGQVVDVAGPAIVDLGDVLKGQVAFARVASPHAVVIRWIDTKGRLCAQSQTHVQPPATTLPFEFPTASALGFNHRIEVLVDGKIAPVSLQFTVRRPYQPWIDYRACVWAGYTPGEADLVRQAGFTGTQNAGRNATDADMAFYCDNIVYRVFAHYHKRPLEFAAMKQAWFANPNAVTLQHRRPSLTDESTYEMVREILLPVVEKAAPFRPIFYNVADEIGVGDQSAVTDLDWEFSSRDAWRSFTQNQYQIIEAANRQYGTNYASWAALRAFFPSTNHMYDQLWSKCLLPRSFGSIETYNAKMGTRYASFADVTTGYANVRSDDTGMTSQGLKQRYRNLDELTRELGTPFDGYEAAAEYLARFEAWAGQQTASDTRGWNLSWWCDWREYMDEYMANGLARAVEIGHKADPGGLFGITGTHHPGVFNGHNYAKLVEKVDCIIPYNIGQSFELIRGLKPEFPYMHPTWNTGDTLRRDLWYHFLHGCRGVLVWDNQEPKHKIIDRGTGTLTERGKASGPTLNEIQSGLDRLLIQGRREHSGVAIYESQMSARVNWFHQFIALGRQYMTRSSGAEYGQDERSVLRTSWMKLIEDNHLQHISITPEQVAQGRLAREGVKALILAETWCLGEEEARRIEAFVRDGGVVIADQYTGLYDGHGKRRDRGALDALFGIDQSAVTGDPRRPLRRASSPSSRPATAAAVPAEAVTASNGPALKLADVGLIKALAAATDGPPPGNWQALCTRGGVVTPVTVVTDGSTLAAVGAGDRSGAAFIVRTVGKGKAIFLNLDVSHYGYVRTDNLPKAEQVLAVVRTALADAVAPPALVNNAGTDRRQMGSEIATWRQGPGRRTLAVWRNFNLNIGGIGGATYNDNALFQKAERIKILLPAKQYVVNQRTGQELGQTNAVEIELLPWEPVILSLSDKPFGGLKVTGPARVQAGQNLPMEIRADERPDTLQVFRVQAVNPEGAAVWYYTRTVSGLAGPFGYEIPTALNEWKGEWTFTVRDVATGKTAETKVTVE